MKKLGLTLTWRVTQAVEGLTWRAVLIAPGESTSRPRFLWTEDCLRAAAPLYEGVPVHMYELGDGFYGHLPDDLEALKALLTRHTAAKISGAKYEEGEGIVGYITFDPRFAWVPESLERDPGFLGLSHDARVRVANEEEPFEVAEILSVSSVDIVSMPAAGGKFLRAVAAMKKGEPRMNLKDLLKKIKNTRPDLLKGVDEAKITDEEIVKIAQMAMEKPASGGGEEDDEAAKKPGKGKGPEHHAIEQPAAAGGVTHEEMKAAMAEAEKKARCAVDLDRAVRDLPEETAERIRERFDGRVFERAQLDDAIKAEKEYLAKMAAPGFDLPDQTRVETDAAMIDKLQAATDQMFRITKADMDALQEVRTTMGNPVFPGMKDTAEAAKGLKPLSGIRELYTLCTGDAEVSGFFRPENMSREMRAAQADFSTSVFDLILGNTLNRRMVRDYRAANYHEDRIISIRKNVKDFKTQEAVMVGYLTDLDTVAKGGDYTEFDAVTDEESTYTISKKGNILPFYREDIINDDISFVDRMVARTGRAARRTHAKAVWGPFISNSNCSDGTAWFTAGHGNLGASALSFATALIAYKALAGMAELDSAEKIGLLDDPMTVKPVLVYPVALMETGDTIVHDDFYYTADALTGKTRNPLKGRIEGVQLSLLTDANDWGMIMPPDVIDIVEVGYLNGRQEPEVFLANVPTQGAVFTNDVIKYKVRHEYGLALIDFRSGYKAVVA